MYCIYLLHFARLYVQCTVIYHGAAPTYTILYCTTKLHPHIAVLCSTTELQLRIAVLCYTSALDPQAILRATTELQLHIACTLLLSYGLGSENCTNIEIKNDRMKLIAPFGFFYECCYLGFCLLNLNSCENLNKYLIGSSLSVLVGIRQQSGV